jgi:hypothetical protein
MSCRKYKRENGGKNGLPAIPEVGSGAEEEKASPLTGYTRHEPFL